MRRFPAASRLATVLCGMRCAVRGSAPEGLPGPADASEGNSFAARTERSDAMGGGDSEAHALLYSVPTLSARTVGREAEVTTLWQNLLSGRRCQLLTGVDGIGKSTVASEFCEAARRSGRFTCIQWFNGQHALDSQLGRFFASMRGRREKDVLLVLDDVAAPEEVAKTLPEHKNLYVVMTSNRTGVTPSAKMSVLSTAPLAPEAAEGLAESLDGAAASTDARAVLDTLGYVPLLVNIASLLMSSEVVSAADLLSALEAKEVMKDHTLTISKALGVLLDIALTEIAKEHPDVRRQLAMLSCFHLSDISDTIIGAVCGDDGAQMAVVAAQLGVLSLKWEDSAFAIHPTVATVAREALSDDDLHIAAERLKGMWPRRWRGMGSHLAYTLVWHTYALSGHFASRGVPLSDDLIACMDRSATFLAHGEARDLKIAASLWHAVFEQQQRQGQLRSSEAVRIARECGRLLHYLRDERAGQVLQAAYEAAADTHGAGSAEAALIMGFLAPYMPASQESVDRLTRSVAVLETRLESVDFAIGREESRMLLETIFVLLVCKGQMLEESGAKVPDSLLSALDAVKARLERSPQ